MPHSSRIKQLISNMSLEQKAGQLQQVRLQGDQADELAAEGRLGSVICANSAWAGNDKQERNQAKQINALQRIAMEQSSHGIPILVARDVIHGHRSVGPIPLGQAASWSPELARKLMRAAAREAVADGIRWTFAPVVDTARDPRWGRIAEGFGEDPYLSGQMGAATIRGIQEDDGDGTAMAACAKHFVGYGAAEGGRDYNTAEISEYTLWNNYLPPFLAAIRAGVMTMMSAFQSINGEPLVASKRLLTGILREKLGFEGIVVSDYEAVLELIQHRVASSLEDSTATAFNAGIDVDMMSKGFGEFLPQLVRAGIVPEARLDTAVTKILEIKERLGLFENPYTDETATKRVHLQAENLEPALEMARKSIVLLKNEGNILPLKKSGVRYLLGGPLFKIDHTLLGTWCLDGVPEDVVTSRDAFRQKLEDPSVLTSISLFDDLMERASWHDIAVLYLGESSDRGGEARSISTLDLPPGQVEQVEALREVGIPIVVVIYAGRPLDLRAIEKHVDAIVYAWHPGTSGGRCVADILFGDENPSGKLPVSFPRSVGHIPAHYNHLSTGRPINPLDRRSPQRYRNSLDAPLYPFGFGLSYTSFAYKNLCLDRDEIETDETATASVDLTNTGDRSGEEVVQLYIRDDCSSYARPVRELKGFRKIRLEPGETQTIEFQIGSEALGYFSPEGQWLLEPGTFTLFCGSDSNCTLNTTLSVKM